MKAPNGKSVANNRATVSISQSVYDRRGLDATCDRSLVNSLNHLTFLTSSSVKVREAMIVDGSIERLVGILHECRKPQSKEEEALCAWKWVLSLQCLVLAGTRGTEKMRAKLVHAGIVPVLATILDNHFLDRKSVINTSSAQSNAVSASTAAAATAAATAPESTGIGSAVGNNGTANNNLPNLNESTGFEFSVTSLLQRSQNTITEMEEILKNDNSNLNNGPEEMSDFSKLMVKRVEYITFLEKLLTIQSPSEIDSMMKNSFKQFAKDELFNGELTRLELSNILNLNGFETPKVNPVLNETFNIPRQFSNGLIVPTTDDVIWCLQLLAFISKYTYLRHLLSNTYVITGLSSRSHNSPPPLESDGIDVDEFMSDHDDVDDEEGDEDDLRTNQDDDDVSMILPEHFKTLPNLKKLNNPNHPLVVDLKDYFDSSDNQSKARNEVKLELDYFRLKHETYGKFKLLNKKLYQERKEKYKRKWNYDECWDELEKNMAESQLIDKDFQQYLTLNIFPLVERFTVKDWFTEDICYWAAVVVRNANRKDETMGGRRQCANFSCGKWEDHPKQFSKCRRCKRAKYCTKECQTKAWVFHKHWCVPAPVNSGTPDQSDHNNVSSTTMLSSRANTPQN